MSQLVSNQTNPQTDIEQIDAQIQALLKQKQELLKNSNSISPPQQLNSTQENSVIIAGYLLKIGYKVRSWKNRFFRLDSEFLSYGAEPNSIRSYIHKSEVLDIKIHHNLQKKGDFGIEIKTTQQNYRNYLLVAATKSERDAWVAALQYWVNPDKYPKPQIAFDQSFLLPKAKPKSKGEYIKDTINAIVKPLLTVEEKRMNLERGLEESGMVVRGKFTSKHPGSKQQPNEESQLLNKETSSLL